jgi:uncharacterized protein YkwD
MPPKQTGGSRLGTVPRPAATLALGLLAIAFPLCAQPPGDGKAGTQTVARRKATVPKAQVPARNYPDPGRMVEPDAFDADLLNALVFDLSNHERRTRGLEPFRHFEALDRVASGHSADMASQGYFSHTARRGLVSRENLAGRLARGGVSFGRAAENIALFPLVVSRTFAQRGRGPWAPRQEIERQGTTYQRLARDIVRGWMDSPGHRRNLLDPELTHMGTGVAIGQRESIPYVYVTQDFSADR